MIFYAGCRKKASRSTAAGVPPVPGAVAPSLIGPSSGTVVPPLIYPASGTVIPAFVLPASGAVIPALIQPASGTVVPGKNNPAASYRDALGRYQDSILSERNLQRFSQLL